MSLQPSKATGELKYKTTGRSISDGLTNPLYIHKYNVLFSVTFKMKYDMPLELCFPMPLEYRMGRETIHAFLFASADIDGKTMIQVTCPLRYCFIMKLKQEVKQNRSHLELIPNIPHSSDVRFCYVPFSLALKTLSCHSVRFCFSVSHKAADTGNRFVVTNDSNLS